MDTKNTAGQKRFIGYCRVSTEGQMDNTSLESQQQKIINYCQFRGWELVNIYIEQGSGKNTKDRPIFNQAMNDLKSCDGLIISHFDRLARNNKDLATLLDDHFSESAGKELVITDLSIDTTSPSGRMILQIMSSVAEFELKKITERTQGGRKAKAEAGGYAYGSPKYGEKSEGGDLVVVDTEAEVIEIIRKHRRSGKSYDKIAQYLSEKKLPTKRGGQWTATMVRKIYLRIEGK
jgi:site-specific DNA recombinase